MLASHVLPAAGLALIVVLATAGCGLKGPLALPEKSESVIIRGPGQTAGPATSPAASEAATGQTATGEAATGGSATGESATGEGAAGGGATGSSTAEGPAVKKAPMEERPPPPPLPGGSNPGTARGG